MRCPEPRALEQRAQQQRRGKARKLIRLLSTRVVHLHEGGAAGEGAVLTRCCPEPAAQSPGH